MQNIARNNYHEEAVGPGRNTVNEVPEDRYFKNKKAHDAIVQSYLIEDRYLSLVESYIDFRIFLHESTLQRNLTPTDCWPSAMECVRRLNRRTLEVLTLGKMYCNHLQESAGVQSAYPTLGDFVKTEIASAGSSPDLLGLGPANALRNYLQHNGVAVDAIINSGSFRLRDGVKHFISSVRPRLGVECVSRVVTKQGATNSGATEMQDDVGHILDQCLISMTNLHIKVRHFIHDEVETAATQLRQLITEWEGRPPVGTSVNGVIMSQFQGEDIRPVERVGINRDLVELHEKLVSFPYNYCQRIDQWAPVRNVGD